MPKLSYSQPPMAPLRPSSDQQQIADHHGRDDERDVDQRIKQGFSRKLAPGQNPRDGDAERQADGHGPERDLQAELDGFEFKRGETENIVGSARQEAELSVDLARLASEAR